MFNIMLNLIFWKTNFGLTEVYLISSISRTLHGFSAGFFSMHRRILGPKRDTTILCKNDSFGNNTCCDLTILFLKTKIYFCRCNFANKLINKKFLISVFCSLHPIGRTQSIPENVCSFENETPNQ